MKTNEESESYSIIDIVCKKGKHIRVVKNIQNNNFEIYSKDEAFLLGVIEFYKPWKTFIWKQSDEAIMSEDCLIEAFKISKEVK